MSTMNRREALRSLLTGTLQTGGTVVLACCALPAVAAPENQGLPADGNLQERADRLTAKDGTAPLDPVAWVNGGFRRGGFANGGGGGGFRRGGWVN